MATAVDTLSQVPDHIPPERVFDFDMFRPEGWEQDVHLAWKRVQDEHPDIFWTPRNGGHWVMTRGEDIKYANEDWRNFSNRAGFIPQGVIPRQFPVQLDPPEHGPYRRLMMPYFLPKNIRHVQEVARTKAIEIIEAVAARGHCDFVGDFAGVMPIVAFLTLVGQPVEDAAYLRTTVVQHNKPESKDAWERRGAYVRDAIEERRRNPRENDLVSQIVHSELNGRKLTEEEIFSWALLVLGGGLDTVTTTLSFIARFLADNPGHRQRLREDPALIPQAIEEFARRFGASNLTRQLVDDLDYKGVRMKAGELLLLPFPLYGLDDRINADPLTVDFDRKGKHCNFGTGPHTCVGAVLARSEIRIFLEEWLARIPDFRVRPGTQPVVHTGIVNNMVELQLEWDVAG